MAAGGQGLGMRLDWLWQQGLSPALFPKEGRGGYVYIHCGTPGVCDP